MKMITGCNCPVSEKLADVEVNLRLPNLWKAFQSPVTAARSQSPGLGPQHTIFPFNKPFTIIGISCLEKHRTCLPNRG
jgi:hypothetical protein